MIFCKIQRFCLIYFFFSPYKVKIRLFFSLYKVKTRYPFMTNVNICTTAMPFLSEKSLAYHKCMYFDLSRLFKAARAQSIFLHWFLLMTWSFFTPLASFSMQCSRNVGTCQRFASVLEGWITVTLASIRLGFIRLFRMKVVSLFHLFFLEAYSKANVIRMMVV